MFGEIGRGAIGPRAPAISAKPLEALGALTLYPSSAAFLLQLTNSANGRWTIPA